MNYLVIYPGRFHIFHLGHKAVYDYLVNKYKNPNAVYIATSDIQEPGKSPFSYSDKVAMLTKMGVPSSHIVKVSNPYSTVEYTRDLPDPENTVLIFAVGAKDQEGAKPRFNFKPKRDGSPSAIQPLPETLKKCQPVSTGVAYVDVVPTQEFKVLGHNANSASEVRKLYIDGNDADRNQIITDLYGAPYPELKEIFDEKLGVDAPQEGIIYGAEHISAGDNPVSIMRERREKLLLKITEMKAQLAHFRRLKLNENQIIDYIDEKKPRKI